MLSKRSVDWLILILIPVVTTLIAKTIDVSLLLEVLLFFGLPPLYLFIRNPSIVKRTLVFSLIPWWPLTIIWEYLAYVDQAWFVPGDIRFFRGSLPLEDIPWGILFLVYGVAVWLHFFREERSETPLFPPKYTFLIALLYIPLIIFMLLYYFKPEILYVPYFFAWMGLLCGVLPITLYLIQKPSIAFVKKLLGMSAYFFVAFSLMDYTAITNNQWYFPGEHFLGIIDFFGHSLPLEEIVVFWILSMPALASSFEYFNSETNK